MRCVGKRAALLFKASTLSSIQEYPMATSAAVKEEAPATKFAKDQLKAIIERIERLEEEKKTISDDIRDVYAEAKGNGFDVKALRLSVISGQTLRVCPEGRPVPTFPDHALAGRHFRPAQAWAKASHLLDCSVKEPKKWTCLDQSAGSQRSSPPTWSATVG
jgi:uncharacterized protein (UPF0335 family)